MPSPYPAVLFDLDGTLAETQAFLVAAYNHVLASVDKPPITIATVSNFRGSTLGANYRVLIPGRTDPEYDEFMAAHRAFQFTHPELIKGFPGTHETLQALTDASIKIGVVTNRGKQTTPIILKHLDLERFVQALVVEGDVHSSKPHPEPFLHCKDKLGLGRDAVCLVVGDAPVDVIGGHAAGCRVARAMWGHGASEPCEEEPEFVPQRITDVLSILCIAVPAGDIGL